MQDHSFVDLLWSMMRVGEFYSAGDLVGLTSFSLDEVRLGLAFLAEFGFLKSLGEPDLVYWKEAVGPSPSEVVTILQSFNPRQTTR